MPAVYEEKVSPSMAESVGHELDKTTMLKSSNIVIIRIFLLMISYELYRLLLLRKSK